MNDNHQNWFAVATFKCHGHSQECCFMTKQFSIVKNFKQAHKPLRIKIWQFPERKRCAKFLRSNFPGHKILDI